MYWYLLQLLPIIATELIDGKQIQSLIEIGEVQRYSISGDQLSLDSKYEIRISHLGTLGSAFQLNWGCPGASTRKLLDTEKLIFFTDHKGQIIGGCDIILVQALRNSRAINLEAQNRPIWYNIKVEKYNATFPLPGSVVPTILLVISFIFVATVVYKIILSTSKLEFEKNL